MEVAGRHVTVLSVGTDDSLVAPVATHLEQVGVDIVHAAEASAALEMLTASRSLVDCVVLEQPRSDTNALALVEAIRTEWPDLPVVLLTTRDSDTAPHEAFRAGVTDYVRDPGPDQYAAITERVVNAVARSRTESSVTDQPTADTYETAVLCPQSRVSSESSRVSSESSRVSGESDHSTETNLQYLVAFQDVVLDASASLMSAELDEITAKVQWTLQSVGEFTGSSRCYVFETDSDGSMTLQHEWRRTGVSPPRAELSAHHVAESRLADRLRRFENVTITETAHSSPDDPLACDLFTERGTAVVVPLVSNWELRGFVGFETTAATRTWPEMEVSILRTVADTIAHTLERERREKQLQRQNERLDRFASVVSHDLRNPLNVVAGFIDLTRQTGDVSHLDSASSAVERMETIIVDVLRLAREGRTVGEVAAVSLDSAVEEAWHAVETQDAQLTLASSTLGTVAADRARLLTVLENLFRNAVDHAGEDTEVRVGRLEASGFYVEDDGPGIPREEHASVFKEGYSTDTMGSGLGLAIVSNVVDAHGWDVDIAAGSAGGARFEISTGGRSPERRTHTSGVECLD